MKTRLLITTVILLVSLTANAMLGLKLSESIKDLAQAQANMTHTIAAWVRHASEYDAYNTYLENFIKINMPDAVWTPR